MTDSDGAVHRRALLSRSQRSSDDEELVFWTHHEWRDVPHVEVPGQLVESLVAGARLWLGFRFLQDRRVDPEVVRLQHAEDPVSHRLGFGRRVVV
jgi:hypothetical protein